MRATNGSCWVVLLTIGALSCERSAPTWRTVDASADEIRGQGCEPVGWLDVEGDSGATRRAELKRLQANVAAVYDVTTGIARAYRCPVAVLNALAGPTAERKRAPDLSAPTAQLLERCNRDDDAEACLEAAEHFVDSDFGQEAPYLEKACEAGLPVACFIRARQLQDETPLRVKGMRIYEARCKAGHQGACSSGARIYRQGLGVPADAARAAALEAVNRH